MRDLVFVNGIEIHKIINPKEFTSAKHSHPYYEFFYVQHSSFNYLIEEEIVTPPDNCIILINKNTFHRAVCPNPELKTYTVMQFHEKIIDDELQNDLEALFSNRLLPIPESDSVLINLLISRILHEYKHNYHNRQTMLRHQVNELIEVFYRISLDCHPLPAKQPPTIAEQAITYINHNLALGNFSQLMLQTVAKNFHMNPCTFSRLFLKQAGIGFKEYVTSAKILHAKKLLSYTDYSITEIAFLSGFSDSNYFSCVFKKFESMTPTEYAKFIKNAFKSPTNPERR